jgi:two-component system, OmpR family, response regulator
VTDEPLRVLIIDDDPDIRTVAQLALGLDPSIIATTASSFDDALATLTSDQPPSVLLLDVMMPGMDGPATAEAVRRLPGHAATPILFMTARARDADLCRYRAIGAGVIVKPFDPLKLARIVREAIAALAP